ncbi:MAG: TrkH family potassium uptake protein [Lachnospiraceae bacterium]
MFKLTKKISTTRLIALSFLLVILTGTILLCLPFSSRSGEWTGFIDALFTATSATCVTGLVVFDTYTHWSLFGQLVILAMIQIGGIGLMTIIIMVFIFLKRKISLHERLILMQSAGTVRVSGMVRLVKRIVSGTLICEGVGALLLSIRFIPRMGFLQGIYYAVFHSVSAFCNAGFDLMGQYEQFSSLTSYETDPLVSIVIMLLIIIGGIGFLVWDEIIRFGIRFKRYSLHAKIVLSTTLFLIIMGTLGIFFLEYHGNLAGLSLPDKLLSSAFMSVTTRTAGFNSMDTATLSEAGSLFSMILMFIGGSPGSTAGGIKTSTLAVVFFAMISMSKGQKQVTLFKRTLDANIVKQASVIIIIYLTGILTATILICHAEPYSVTDILFETISAAATVGLSRGLTPTLGTFSHIILAILMFGGRIGGLSMMLVFGEEKPQPPVKRPTEPIIIG